MAGLVPDNIVQLTYGSSQLRGMWSALRLAESAKYPGWCRMYGIPLAIYHKFIGSYRLGSFSHLELAI